jgi:hypothetical protein
MPNPAAPQNFVAQVKNSNAERIVTIFWDLGAVTQHEIVLFLLG